MNFLDKVKHIGQDLGLTSEIENSELKSSKSPSVAPTLVATHLENATESPTAKTSDPVQSGSKYLDSWSSECETVYQRLVSRTDFSQTPPAQTLNKFLSPLESLPLDSSMKFKTAMAQAKAQGGLTEEAIMGAFDTMAAALTAAEESFKTKQMAFEQREISSREKERSEATKRITDLQSEIEKAENDQQRLTTEIGQCTEKFKLATEHFQQAMNRRSQDIASERAKYTEMIGLK